MTRSPASDARTTMELLQELPAAGPSRGGCPAAAGEDAAGVTGGAKGVHRLAQPRLLARTEGRRVLRFDSAPRRVSEFATRRGAAMDEQSVVRPCPLAVRTDSRTTTLRAHRCEERGELSSTSFRQQRSSKRRVRVRDTLDRGCGTSVTARKFDVRCRGQGVAAARIASVMTALRPARPAFDVPRYSCGLVVVILAVPALFGLR